MILGVENVGMALRIATMVVPVAVYFLVLGLLNSRRHPQLLSGRMDFALMVTALSPVFILPALQYVGPSWLTVLAMISVLAAGIVVLAPRGGSWVIYNLPPAEARKAVLRALDELGVRFQEQGRTIRIEDPQTTLTIRSFSLLRNVSLHLDPYDGDLSARLERRLSRMLGRLNAETSPTAVSFLLVATAMLVAPLSMVAHRVPEIVRILTDLL